MLQQEETMTLTEGNIGGVYLVTGMKLQESITRRLEALGMKKKRS